MKRKSQNILPITVLVQKSKKEKKEASESMKIFRNA